MHASRTPLSLLLAAVALCAFGAPSAWAWGVEAQRTLPGVTNADRAVVDSNGDIYLLDQFGAVNPGGDPYPGHQYSLRVLRVSPDLQTVTQAGPTIQGRSFNQVTDPIDFTLSVGGDFDLTPTGLAIDRERRVLYVSAGDRIEALSLGSGTWRAEPFVAPGTGAWFSRRVVPGPMAVDPVSNELFVADVAGIGSGLGDPEGAARILRVSPTGETVSEIPLSAECATGQGTACPLGRFDDGLNASYFGVGAHALHVVGGSGGRRLAYLHTRHNPGSGQTFDHPELGFLGPDGVPASSSDALVPAFPSRPLGGREAQALEFAPVHNGLVAPVLPSTGVVGASGLFEMNSTGTGRARFMAYAPTSSDACALKRRSVRLASVPVGADDARLVVVEDSTSTSSGPVRVTVLRQGATGCAETVFPSTSPPVIGPAQISGVNAAGDTETVPVTPGGTVRLNIPRGADGSLPSDVGNVESVRWSDPDNGGTIPFPWTRCVQRLEGGPATSLYHDGTTGCTDFGSIPTAAVLRPSQATIDVIDDEGETATLAFRLASRDPLSAGLDIRPVEASPGSFRFTMDEVCEEPPCTSAAEFTQLSLGPIDTWSLDFGDGETVSGDWRNIRTPAEHAYAGDGTFTATLTLKAAGQADAVATKTVTVDRGDTSTPVADLTAAPAAVTQGAPITFTPRNTGTGTVASWTLSFGDGDETSGTRDDLVPVAHTYRSTGSFTARLSIELTNGRSASTTQTVTVTARERPQVPGQDAIKSCMTPFGIPLSLLGLGDQSLCTADPCDLDLAQLGLTNFGIERPARCDVATGATETEGAGETVAPLGARGRIASSRLTLSRDGRIAIRIRCLDGAGACAGAVALDLRPATGGSRRLATARFTRLPVGAVRTLRVRPAASARTALVTEIERRLRRGQRAAVRLKVSPSATPAAIARPSAQTAAGTISASRSTVRALGRRTATKRRPRT